MEWLLNPDIFIAFLTLTALEIILGIDNIIFISVLVSRVPEQYRDRIRIIGLGMAMLMRIGLLFALSWIMASNAPLFTVFDHAVSVRDLILLLGGLFLLGKSTSEIHGSLESERHITHVAKASLTFVVLQILVIDLVFSIDSIITAIGMAKHIEVMIAAVVCAVGVMMISSAYISKIIEAHPTLKMLALSFLMLIGMSLVADGLGVHIPKAYLYFAMGFSIVVEILNIRLRKSKAPVALKRPLTDEEKYGRGEN
ncbi:MAG: hypothetical protein C9356_10305 [Oleiphilus sp.]|nr:MAG: hypothetical protein C9356_10305 [Oleiphilus sp.]